jgi:penicillin-binding protein 1A
VVRMGTGAAASQLKHPLGGKTGTTNDYTDAWFIGFSPSITCGTWIGFDDRQSLGEKETGARAALPMWMDFMRVAIADKPNETFAAEGAPKKVLDVPLNKADVQQPALKIPDEEEPDAPPAPAAEGVSAPKAGISNAAPADTAAPVERKNGEAARPKVVAKPVSPAKGDAVPLKPEDERKGVAKPPADTN